MNTQAPPQQGGNKVQIRPYPFPVGVYESTVQDYDQTVALGATVAAWTGTTQAPIWNVSPTGWMRRIWVDFTLYFSGSNAAGSFAGNGPFSLVKSMTLYDLGGEVIISISGYEWFTLNKWGGYFEVGDPRADITYATNPATGNSAATPAAHFILAIPLEVVERDALGTVQNESKPGWKIEIVIDSATNTVDGGTAFTSVATNPTVRVRGYIDSYTEPAAAAPGGRPFSQTPPLPGTLQYWKSEDDTLSAGTSKFDLSNGIGFPIRNVIYYVTDASDGTRATADGNWPDPITLLIGNVNYFTRSKNLFVSKLGKDFGLTSATADTALGRENGVFPVYFTKDFGLKPGAELRFKYLDTQVNTLVRLTGSYGASTVVHALTNWLATPSRNRYALIAG